MPMPTPNKDESQEDFIKRFMADSLMVKEYPDEKQRYKIALEQWKEKVSAAESKMTEEMLGGWWDVTASDIKFTGTSNGKPITHTYSKEEIQQMAEGYDPEVLEAPVKIEHTDEGQAHGWVEKVRVKAKNGRLYLQARLKELSETLRKALLDGSYRSRSVEVYINFKNTGKPYFSGLAFLGAGTPAMINLSPFPTLSAGLCDGVIRCSGTGGPESLTFEPISEQFNLETKEISEMEAKDITKAITDGFSSVLSKFKGEEAEDDSAIKLKAAEDAQAEAEGKVEAAEKAQKEAEDKLKAKEIETELATFKANVEKARDESRITPVDSEMYIRLGADLPEEKRKTILEDITAREPNKILSELSAKDGNKTAKITRTSQMRKDSEALWAMQKEPNAEDKRISLRAYDLMDADEKMELGEAQRLAASE